MAGETVVPIWPCYSQGQVSGTGISCWLAPCALSLCVQISQPLSSFNNACPNPVPLPFPPMVTTALVTTQDYDNNTTAGQFSQRVQRCQAAEHATLESDRRKFVVAQIPVQASLTANGRAKQWRQ